MRQVHHRQKPPQGKEPPSHISGDLCQQKICTEKKVSCDEASASIGKNLDKGKSPPPQATAPGISHKNMVLKGNYKILAGKVQFLKYFIDGFREMAQELQLFIDILEKVDEMC
ncbi:hypothetical protein PVAP13_7KG041100 [Panicum virgatum]|uniref:Uncharacterized protein n=1 Tax=Panicum virgatum TaxID=38727 RepID=A0A8T0QAR8_PANVG|nr:hypothetical protein PVAP13_7KG041100 [Panicum virgatum]